MLQIVLIFFISLVIQSFNSEPPPVRYTAIVTKYSMKKFFFFLGSVSWYSEASKENIFFIDFLDIQPQIPPQLQALILRPGLPSENF